MNNEQRYHFKGWELFYRTTLRKDFQADIVKIRKEVGIPDGGFVNDKDLEKWTKSRTASQHYAIQKRLPGIMKKYKLPPTLWSELYFYIEQTNNSTSPLIYTFLCSIESGAESSNLLINGSMPAEKMWKESGHPFVKLFISDLASLDYTRDYLEKNWKGIQGVLDKQRGSKKKRVRATKNKSLKKEILSLSLKSSVELAKEIKGPVYDKATAIAVILKKKYDKNIEGDNVRQVIYRQKKLRK